MFVIDDCGEPWLMMYDHVAHGWPLLSMLTMEIIIKNSLTIFDLNVPWFLMFSMFYDGWLLLNKVAYVWRCLTMLNYGCLCSTYDCVRLINIDPCWLWMSIFDNGWRASAMVDNGWWWLTRFKRIDHGWPLMIMSTMVGHCWASLLWLKLSMFNHG